MRGVPTLRGRGQLGQGGFWGHRPDRFQRAVDGKKPWWDKTGKCETCLSFRHAVQVRTRGGLFCYIFIIIKYFSIMYFIYFYIAHNFYNVKYVSAIKKYIFYILCRIY